MFNGIIEERGKISSARDTGSGKELKISCEIASALEVDNSLCVNGVCQTVVKCDKNSITVQVVEETLSKTTLGSLKPGEEVNLERSLSLSNRIDGHIVQGHVDTTGTLTDIRREGSNRLCTIAFEPEWKDLVVGRGSVAVDGISLTIARDMGDKFLVAIIPYTWKHTVIGNRKKGDKVNLEFDILGKYVWKFMQNRQGNTQSRITGASSPATENPGTGRDKINHDKKINKGLTEQMLRDSGFM